MRNLLTLAGVGLMAVFLAVSILSQFSPSVVRAEDDHGDYRAQATAIGIGSGVISGNIDETALFFDVDYFAFETRRGVQYTFTLDLTGITDANITVIDSVERGAGVAEGQDLAWDSRGHLQLCGAPRPYGEPARYGELQRCGARAPFGARRPPKASRRCGARARCGARVRRKVNRRPSRRPPATSRSLPTRPLAPAGSRGATTQPLAVLPSRSTRREPTLSRAT